jgi:hypothetical protein
MLIGIQQRAYTGLSEQKVGVFLLLSLLSDGGRARKFPARLNEIGE